MVVSFNSFRAVSQLVDGEHLTSDVSMSPMSLSLSFSMVTQRKSAIGISASPVPRQQLIDVFLLVSIHDSSEDVGQVSIRIGSS